MVPPESVMLVATEYEEETAADRDAVQFGDDALDSRLISRRCSEITWAACR